jgi:hypothetical protein
VKITVATVSFPIARELLHHTAQTLCYARSTIRDDTKVSHSTNQCKLLAHQHGIRIRMAI